MPSRCCVPDFALERAARPDCHLVSRWQIDEAVGIHRVASIELCLLRRQATPLIRILRVVLDEIREAACRYWSTVMAKRTDIKTVRWIMVLMGVMR